MVNDNNHVVGCLIDNSVVAAFHFRHHSCSDKSSELCLEAEVLNPLTGACFSMDAIHGKVGLPNFVLSQPGHLRQQPDTIDLFAEKPCGGYLWLPLDLSDTVHTPFCEKGKVKEL